jgi:fluoride exporter
MNNILLVFIGGGIGSVLRYLVGKIIATQIKLDFPIATLIANVFAVLVFGLFIFYQKYLFSDRTESLKTFVLIGICGGLSTFSTFSFESVQLLKEGKILFFFLNVILSFTLCFSIIYMFLSKSKID